MSDSFGLIAANALWLASGSRAARAFRRALKNPRAVQKNVLVSLIRQNAAAKYGERHEFSRLRSIRDYQDAVPVVTYDDLDPEIERIKRGEQGVLTEEPVLMLEKTTGSAGAAKYIPYTTSLRREFQRAVASWMADLYGRRPRMLGGGAYWSISPLAREREVTVGGLRVGFDDDTEYLGRLEQRLIRRILPAPPELAQIDDIVSSRYATVRFLLQSPRLSFISVWNPSFLTLLVRFLWQHTDRLIDDLRRGTVNAPQPLPENLRASLARKLRPLPARADELEAIVRQCGKLLPPRIWPALTVVSCWASAGAALFRPELERMFPGIEIQPKGLLATEGVVTIPLTGHPGAAPAITSHFFEFVESERPGARPVLVDELEAGRKYSVLISTGGGLYRYALGDYVEVVGRVGPTPLVEFVGKGDLVSDLCGEKLAEPFVRAIIESVFHECRLQPLFALLAPEGGSPPRYLLYFEAEQMACEITEELARLAETGLRQNPHYAYCRQLGQLGELRAVRIKRGSERYLERCAALGQRRGGIKPAALHTQMGWSAWFGAGAPERDGQAAQ